MEAFANNYFIIWALCITLALVFVSREFRKLKAQIKALQIQVELLIKESPTTKQNSPKQEPKYAAGDDMDNIRNGTPFYF